MEIYIGNLFNTILAFAPFISVFFFHLVIVLIVYTVLHFLFVTVHWRFLKVWNIFVLNKCLVSVNIFIWHFIQQPSKVSILLTEASFRQDGQSFYHIVFLEISKSFQPMPKGLEVKKKYCVGGTSKDFEKIWNGNLHRESF